MSNSEAVQRQLSGAVSDWVRHPVTWACLLLSLLLGHVSGSLAVWVVVVALPYYQANQRHSRLVRRQLTAAVLRYVLPPPSRLSAPCFL
jgi:hypothetical protein